jgi:hypothetical protein
VLTTLKLFRDEFEAHVKEGRCTKPAPGAPRRRRLHMRTDVVTNSNHADHEAHEGGDPLISRVRRALRG